MDPEDEIQRGSVWPAWTMYNPEIDDDEMWRVNAKA